MALPADLTVRTLHGKYVDYAGAPAAGTVTIKGQYPLRDPAGNVIVVPTTVTLTLDVNGEFTTSLPATDDLDVTPNGWAYSILEKFVGFTQEYFIELPAAGSGTVELADLAPVADSIDVTRYVTFGEFDTLIDASPLSDRVGVTETDLTNATPLPTVFQLIRRDGAGRAQVATPAVAADIATKGYIDGLRGAANGVATLDSGSKIPQAQLPAVALADFLGAVGSQAAMLALTGQRGDWATRTDLGTDWQLIADTPTVLASWRQTTYPVTSVAGRAGAVTLASADITDATSAATASVLVKRDTFANANFNEAIVAGQTTAASATRKDYVDARAVIPVYAQVRPSGGAQTLTTATITMLNMGTADFDTHAGAAATGWTCPVAGVYEVSGIVPFAANATGTRYAAIAKNGTVQTGSLGRATANGTDSTTAATTPGFKMTLAVNDLVQLAGFQNSGGNLATLVSTPSTPLLTIRRVF